MKNRKLKLIFIKFRKIKCFFIRKLKNLFLLSL